MAAVLFTQESAGLGLGFRGLGVLGLVKLIQFRWFRLSNHLLGLSKPEAS